MLHSHGRLDSLYRNHLTEDEKAASERQCARTNAARRTSARACSRQRFQWESRCCERYCGFVCGALSNGMRGGLLAAARSSDRLVRNVAIAWSGLAGFNCSRASESYT